MGGSLRWVTLSLLEMAAINGENTQRYMIGEGGWGGGGVLNTYSQFGVHMSIKPLFFSTLVPEAWSLIIILTLFLQPVLQGW